MGGLGGFLGVEGLVVSVLFSLLLFSPPPLLCCCGVLGPATASSVDVDVVVVVVVVLALVGEAGEVGVEEGLLVVGEERLREGTFPLPLLAMLLLLLVLASRKCFCNLRLAAGEPGILGDLTAIFCKY
jgi:hypothetical protein